MTMRRAVCLDGRSLGLRHGTGVSTYATRLRADLPGAGWEVDVLLDEVRSGAPEEGRAARWARAAWPSPSRAVAVDPPEGFGQAWVAPDAFRRAQVFFDIHRRLMPVATPAPPPLMHWTYPVPLRVRGTRNVYTIHDLIPLLHPELSPIAPRRLRRILRRIVRTADCIVTVSEAARADIIRHLRVPERRVVNTYNAIDVSGAAPDAPARGHFLFCGVIEPRKNVSRLLAAHAASKTATPLVLAGPDGWRAASEMAGSGVEVRPLDAMPPDARGGAWRAPWLPRPALLALMRDAKAVLFPSLAEGFGIPVAEAMALGVPVLTSRGGATEEVAGGAAMLVDPTDTAAMAEAIAALDRDGELRRRLAASGPARAAAFSPAACMNRLTAAYEGVLDRKRPRRLEPKLARMEAV